MPWLGFSGDMPWLEDLGICLGWGIWGVDLVLGASYAFVKRWFGGSFPPGKKAHTKDVH